MKRSGFYALWIIAIFLAFWFYKAHLLKQDVAKHLAKLEKVQNPTFKYEGLSTTGFPFSVEVAIKNPTISYRAKEDEKNASNVSLDGNLIVGSNLQGTKYWLTQKGNLHINNEDTQDHWLLSGDQTFAIHVPEYHFTKGFPESFNGDSISALIKDLTYQGEFYGNHVSLSNNLFPMYDFDSYYLDWNTRDKDKGLKLFDYKFTSKGIDTLYKKLQKEDPSLPDAGVIQASGAGDVLFDPNLPTDDFLKFALAIQTTPLSINIKNFDSQDNFHNQSFNFHFSIQPQEDGKLAISSDSSFDAKFSKGAFDKGMVEMKEYVKESEAIAEPEEKAILEKLPEFLAATLPKFYEWGQIIGKTDWNLNLKMTSIPFVPSEFSLDIKHFDFLTDKGGWEIHGNFIGGESRFIGDLTLDLINYRSLIEGISDYYNESYKAIESHFGLPLAQWARPIPKETVDNIIAFVNKISDEPGKETKDTSITLKIPPDRKVTIGTLKLDEAVQDFNQLYDEVYKKITPEAPTPEPATAPEPATPAKTG